MDVGVDQSGGGGVKSWDSAGAGVVKKGCAAGVGGVGACFDEVSDGEKFVDLEGITAEALHSGVDVEDGRELAESAGVVECPDAGAEGQFAKDRGVGVGRSEDDAGSNDFARFVDVEVSEVVGDGGERIGDARSAETVGVGLDDGDERDAGAATDILGVGANGVKINGDLNVFGAHS